MRALCLALSLLCFGCSSFTADHRDVDVRLLNASAVALDRVAVDFASGLETYTALPAGQYTGYRRVEAYRYAGVRLVVDGNTYGLQPIDYVGETRLRPGKYTYRLTVTLSADPASWEGVTLELVKDS